MSTQAIMCLVLIPVVLCMAGCATAGGRRPKDDAVYFQAHRGGVREVPENTMAAYRYAWRLGGIPEVDVRDAKDGVIVCFHDNTLGRTTNIARDRADATPESMTYDELAKLDAGAWFDARFAGERIPTLREVFAEMQGHPDRQAYLDLKTSDLEQLAALIGEFGVARQVIFCHNNQENCIKLGELAPGVRTMLWIGGKPDAIKARFEKAAAGGFEGLDQVQLHLAPAEGNGPVRYLIEPEFLTHALNTANAANIDLEVLPFALDRESLIGLLDLGIRWYATDEPLRFTRILRDWRVREALGAPVFFQAHRGGKDEVPENTLAGFRYAWDIPGAVPEVDIQTSEDGVIFCLHDDTLARTTNATGDAAETPATELTFDEMRKWDAGVRFDKRFAGEKVPSLDELLAIMAEDSRRELYLDLKNIDLDALHAALMKHGVLERVIFVHGNPDVCYQLQQKFPGARTMTWLSGSPEDIKAKYAAMAANGFRGVTQLQFHLKVKGIKGGITYVLDDEFLAKAVDETRAAGVELQLRPFRFDADSMRHLVDMGVYWYVADAPGAFAEAVKQAMAE